MAGRPKYGLGYASIVSSLLTEDRRIDNLISAQGWRGVGVYMYLLLRAYGDYGYFTEWCFADCATTARKMGGGVSATHVQEAIYSCVQNGLFDKRLLETWGILTNTDIQEAYLSTVKRRRLKVFWVPEYWLLEEKPPCDSLVPCGQNKNQCSDNAQNHNDNGDNHNDNAPVRVMGKSNISTTTTTSSKLEIGARHESQIPLLLSSEEIEARQKKYGPALGQWEDVIGRLLTAFELEDVCALVNEYGGQWVIDAMRVAGEAGKSSLRFVKGVLNNWKTDGREAKKPAQSDVNVYGKAEQILAERRAKRAAEKGSV